MDAEYAKKVLETWKDWFIIIAMKNGRVYGGYSTDIGEKTFEMKTFDNVCFESALLPRAIDERDGFTVIGYEDISSIRTVKEGEPRPLGQ